LKEEALDRTTWRAHFGRGFGPVVRQNTELMNRSALLLLRGYGEIYIDRLKDSYETEACCYDDAKVR
jgi:hypothetical protein